MTAIKDVSKARRVRIPQFLYGKGGVGAGMLLLVLLVAFVGPLIAPNDPTLTLGPAFGEPTGQLPLGSDNLGRDTLSRVLNGGASVFGIAFAATCVAYLIGLPTGLVAAYYGGRRVDTLIMRSVDVLLAFPPLLFLLVVATWAQGSVPALIFAAGIVLGPSLTRIIRSATLEVARLAYIEAAEVRGDRVSRIILREVLPNISDVILADIGIRFTYSVLLTASLSYLGLGLAPPASNWALMISENQGGMELVAWPVIVPAALIAVTTISTNLIADALAASFGKSRRDFGAESSPDAAVES